VTDEKFTYGNAVAIFALAHAYRVTKDERYREAALTAWRAVSFGLKDSTGGFRVSAPRDFGPSSGLRVLDPAVATAARSQTALSLATRDGGNRANACAR
jgi:hypothetical protein